jgi:predicted RND superfamily exporter protein
MFTNAMSGMICSILFAFLVLLLTTHNYLVSLYSIIAILMVIATIFSTIYFQGYGIGIAESIALIVFIGFSVDYIVHMCH